MGYHGISWDIPSKQQYPGCASENMGSDTAVSAQLHHKDPDDQPVYVHTHPSAGTWSILGPANMLTGEAHMVT